MKNYTMYGGDMENNIIQKKSYTKVIDYIKNQIIMGELKTGEKLPSERELSEMLGLSRNSVREAIRTLDFMGVVSSQHGAGNYLTGNFENNLVESMSMMFLLNQIDYKQISQLRRGLELQALMIAIDNAAEQEISRLVQINSKLENQTEKNNIILDKELHYNIAIASKNTLIINILQALSEVMDKFIADLRGQILAEEESGRKLRDAHSGIVKSLVLRDKTLGLNAINKHFDVIDEKLESYNFE